MAIWKYHQISVSLYTNRGVAQLASASGLGPEGRVFESHHPDICFYPEKEAPIISKQPGWAEQDPSMWLGNLKLATADVLHQLGEAGYSAGEVKAIGISYQMHGLVCVDKDMNVLRPSIIWCDSRAVPYGNAAAEALGQDFCLEHLLNSPGNFTAAKLAWVKENEPALYERIWKIMLPGDYIAMRLTGIVCTTVSGLSEGIFWDFRENAPSKELLGYFGFDETLLEVGVDDPSAFWGGHALFEGPSAALIGSAGEERAEL